MQRNPAGKTWSLTSLFSLAFLLVLLGGCAQRSEKPLFIETELPIEIKLAYRANLESVYIELLDVRYNVDPDRSQEGSQYPYVKVEMINRDRTKYFRLSKFAGEAWIAAHVRNGEVIALLDYVVEGPGNEFHLVKIGKKGEIQELGEIKKKKYLDVHVKSYIKGNTLTVITEDDTEEVVRSNEYRFVLTNK